jgi:hypothetical protein
LPGRIILSVKELGPALCPKRHEHLAGASVTLGTGVASQQWSAETLYEEQEKGIVYVLATNASQLEWPSAVIAKCVCDSGYILRHGPNAIQLTREARDGH